MDFVPVKLAGLFNSRIHPEISIELFGGGEQVKRAHLRYQDDGAEEPYPTQRLKQTDAVIYRFQDKL